MEWMLDIQLGRRNLSPIQRIAVTEKYRPIYEKQARENLVNAGKYFGIGKDEKPLVNLPNPIKPINTSEKLASVAGVSEKTYRMGAKILNSDNEEVKEKVLSGEIGNGNRKSRYQNGTLNFDEISQQLGIKTVMCDVHTYNNDDEVLADLIETNIRQRGIGNTNQRKMGLCIKELDRIYGIREGSAGKVSSNLETNNFTPKTEDELLKSLGLGVDKRTIQNYKKLTELIPELEELLDTGIISQTPTIILTMYIKSNNINIQKIKGGDNMANVTTSIRMDADTKKAATELLNDLGLDLSSAVNIFLKQVVLQGGLPFQVKYPQYKPEVLEAMEEAKAISHNPETKSYGSFVEALEDIDL